MLEVWGEGVGIFFFLITLRAIVKQCFKNFYPLDFMEVNTAIYHFSDS